MKLKEAWDIIELEAMGEWLGTPEALKAAIGVVNGSEAALVKKVTAKKPVKKSTTLPICLSSDGVY
jgi:hypothetical protein